MNHTSTRRRAGLSAAVALAALLSSGATTSTAAAAPHEHAKHTHAEKGHGQHGRHGHHGQKPRDGRDKLAKQIAKVDAALVRVERKAARLGDVLGPQVTANVEADRAALAVLTTKDEVDAVRPEAYQTIIADLRQLSKLQARLATVVDDPDATEVAASSDALVQRLLGMSATTPRSELRSVKRDIAAVKALLEDDDTSDDEPEDEPSESEG